MKKKINKKNKSNNYSILILLILCILLSIFIGYEYTTFIQDKKTKTIEKAKEPQKAETIKETAINKPVKPEVNIPGFQKYKYIYTYNFDIKGNVKNFKFKIPIPKNEDEKQYIIYQNYSIQPTNFLSDGVNNYAEYSIPEINNQNISFTIEGEVNARTYDLKTAKLINKNTNIENNLNRYLKEESLIEVNDPYIKQIAHKITGNTKEEIVGNIYKYLQQNIKYTIIPNCGAKKALQNKKGKCAEYAAAMIALCRAKNIPARLVIGHIARDYNTRHGWVEVYYDEYGWVTYDPTVQGTTVQTLDKNGKVIKEEIKYDTDKSITNYIISGRNNFTPWNITYGLSPKGNAKVIPVEYVQITKL